MVPNAPSGSVQPAPKHWNTSVKYGAACLHLPTGIEELQILVQNAHKCHALGQRHSASDCADTDGDLISLENIQPQVCDIDERDHTVTCSAGMRLDSLADRLNQHGWALHNLPSRSDISIVGAIATATHGSGDGNGCLTTALIACDYVDAEGTLVSCGTARSLATADETLQAVMLGAVGVIVEVTLKIERSFDVRQDVYADLPWARLEEPMYLNDLFARAYSVSVFTDFLSDAGAFQAWFKHKVPRDANGTPGRLPPAPEVLFGAKKMREAASPIPKQPPSTCTSQGEPIGPWSKRLGHFCKLDDSGEFYGLQSEYFVARDNATDAVKALRELGKKAFNPMLVMAEIRSVASDEIWLSPAYRRPSLSFRFFWAPAAEAKVVRRLTLMVEGALAPFSPRPHWGMLFGLRPSMLRSLYPKLPEYCDLVAHLDPDGKFRNPFLRAVIFAEIEETAGPSSPVKDSAPFPHFGRTGRYTRPYDLIFRQANGTATGVTECHILAGGRLDEPFEVPHDILEEERLLTRSLYSPGGAVRYSYFPQD